MRISIISMNRLLSLSIIFCQKTDLNDSRDISRLIGNGEKKKERVISDYIGGPRDSLMNSRIRERRSEYVLFTFQRRAGSKFRVPAASLKSPFLAR